jgi:dolichol kinase
MPMLLGILFLLSVLIEFMRFKSPFVQSVFFKYFGSMLRKEEHFKITGSTWVIGAAFICSIVFDKERHIAFMVLSMFILGDAVAALVGIGIGRIKIGVKSLEGSLACFLICMVLFYAVFPFVPGLLDTWEQKIPVALTLITSFVITVLELIPLKVHPKIVINDNLAVPVIAGYVMAALERIFT